eukprot:1346499-Amorphochlora_amoeboformis.AAC.1
MPTLKGIAEFERFEAEKLSRACAAGHHVGTLPVLFPAKHPAMSKKLPDLPKSDSTPRLGRFPSYARGTANSNRRKESQNANFRCKPRRRHGSAGNFIHMERRR